MNPNKRLLFIGFVVLSLFGTILTFVFNRDAPPVSALEIPKSTIDFFKKLGDIGHIKFDYVDSLDVGDFDNDNDYSGDFKKLEDDNFIVYFHENSKEQARAERTLQYANMAIPELARFFGKYYYATDAKNRKLAIYLATSQDDFDETATRVGGSTVEWAAGLTFNSFSSNGDKMCEGIVLNHMVQDGEPTDLKKVVFHEIAHYNHFQCMDLLRKSKYMNWEVEGIASYFAKDWNKQIPEGSNINSLSLTEDPNNYIDSYWMGYHAFGLAEKLGCLKGILENSYSESLLRAIPKNANCTMSEYDGKWKNHCRSIARQQ